MTIEYVIKYLYTKIMWVLPIIMPNSCLLIISVYVVVMIKNALPTTVQCAHCCFWRYIRFLARTNDSWSAYLAYSSQISILNYYIQYIINPIVYQR